MSAKVASFLFSCSHRCDESGCVGTDGEVAGDLFQCGASFHIRLLQASSLQGVEETCFVLLLRNWLRALRAEIRGIEAMSKKCAKGLDQACTARIVDLQIALDEACGYAKEEKENAY